MSSKPRDSGTMNQASAGAQAADTALANSATQNQDFLNKARLKLFGPNAAGGDFSGGTMSGFLDPNSLKVDHPTGTYGLQYNKATENIANQGEQNRGALARGWASRGFGNAPAGFQQDQAREQLSDQSNQQGAAFTDLAGKSYQDALQNFWRASGALQGEGDSALSAAIGADTAAGNNYANLYGSASTPKPSVLGQVVGGGLQAGGTIGAAAMCPCEGSMILMQDGTEKPIQDCRKGEQWQGIDGQPCELLADPRMVQRDSVEVRALEARHRCSVDHTFALPQGGYEFAFKSKAKNVRFRRGITTVLEVSEIGVKDVYVVEVGGSHTFRADGFWCLS